MWEFQTQTIEQCHRAPQLGHSVQEMAAEERCAPFLTEWAANKTKESYSIHTWTHACTHSRTRTPARAHKQPIRMQTCLRSLCQPCVSPNVILLELACCCTHNVPIHSALGRLCVQTCVLIHVYGHKMPACTCVRAHARVHARTHARMHTACTCRIHTLWPHSLPGWSACCSL